MLNAPPLTEATISQASCYKYRPALASLLSRRVHQPCELSCVMVPVQSPENSPPLLEISHLMYLWIYGVIGMEGNKQILAQRVEHKIL